MAKKSCKGKQISKKTFIAQIECMSDTALREIQNEIETEQVERIIAKGLRMREKHYAKR